MKRLISALLSVFSLLALAAPALGASEPSRKEEAVYALLDAAGNVKNIYVVNIFSGGAVTDYGDYSKVINLTDTRKITQKGGMISAEAGTGRLRYQGTLNSRELPWSIKISYTLDGKEIKASELAGASGALELRIEIAQNPKADPAFYDNYALQISLQLDADLCENIAAENATIANAGGFKQLSYTVLPGRGADIKIRADVRDFEMKEISVSGIKLTLDLDIDYGDISGELAQLSDAVAKLDGGAGELTEGARRLSEGMRDYAEGLKRYRDGVAALERGAAELSGGVSALSGGLAELAAQNEALLSGALAMQQAAFDQANDQLASYNLNLPELTPENYASALSASPMLAPAKERLDGVVSFVQGLKAYTEGVSGLSSGASQLEKGASGLAAASSKLAASASDLYKGAAELDSAVLKLYEGLAEYRNGVSELKSNTSDLGGQAEAKVRELLDGMFGKGGKPVSFVSEKNTNVDAVQFAMKTEAIEKPKAEAYASEPSGADNPTLWQRLLKLFGIKGKGKS